MSAQAPERPRVSVIVPNYNHAPYLRGRLQSVLDQTLGDLEVIFMDDASTDQSLAVFEPFRETLKQIRNFRLHSREPIDAEESTGVKEFDELNRFIRQMTEKAVADYQHLKEFAENASHELQTPLSIVRGKLELLQESDLNSEQHDYEIGRAHV